MLSSCKISNFSGGNDRGCDFFEFFRREELMSNKSKALGQIRCHEENRYWAIACYIGTFTWKIFRENDFLHNNVDFTGKVQSFWNYILPELCFEITRAFSLASSSGMLHFFVVNNWEFWSARLETYFENPRKIVKNQKNIAVR